MRCLSLFQPALLAFIVSAIAGCGSGVTRVPSQNLTEYHVMRTQSPIAIDADWNKSAWKAAPVIELTHFMGTRPEHFPRTRARFAYDDHFLYVIFKVDDRYVRAATPRHQGETCRDSCVEFFFSPGMDISAGYFNIEMNCGGTMLFNFQREAFKNVVLIRDEDLLRIESAHTQPRIVDPEIAAPVT